MCIDSASKQVANEVGGSLQNEHAKSQSAGRSRHHAQQRQQHHQAVNDAAGWNKEMRRVEEVTHAQLSDPTLDLSRTRHTDQATYELSEMNRARAQRWNEDAVRNKAFVDSVERRLREDATSVFRHPVKSMGRLAENTVRGVVTLFSHPVQVVEGVKYGIQNYMHADPAMQGEMLAGGFVDFCEGNLVGAGIGGVAKVTLPLVSRMGMYGGRGVEGVMQVTTKHPLAGLSPENVLRLADEIGLNTPKDQLILWSGLGRGSTGVKLSQEFAHANGGVTLEMTSGGKWLNEMDLYGINSPFTQAEADNIWRNVSSHMIQQASGQVRSLIGQVRPASIYRIEQSEILMNEKILGLDELYLKPRIIFGK